MPRAAPTAPCAALVRLRKSADRRASACARPNRARTAVVTLRVSAKLPEVRRVEWAARLAPRAPPGKPAAAANALVPPARAPMAAATARAASPPRPRPRVARAARPARRALRANTATAPPACVTRRRVQTAVVIPAVSARPAPTPAAGRREPPARRALRAKNVWRELVRATRHRVRTAVAMALPACLMRARATLNAAPVVKPVWLARAESAAIRPAAFVSVAWQARC